ncbi:MAG: alpha/beta hydrolase, partial [Pseudomonadota bacterium]
QALDGDVTREDGAIRTLLSELQTIIDYARSLPESDGRIALLGHSMASDIVVRAARADQDIAATVAISMFTREVTQAEPRNLLMITGEYERFLSAEALKAVALATGGPAEEAVTYGDPADGTARRAVLADGTEHASVLFSREAMVEAVAWLHAVFDRDEARHAEMRGPWILLLLAGVVALAWPLSALLPRLGGAIAEPLPRGHFWAICLGPAVLTPLILWPLPTHFLPVLVADYLAVHFALYGGLTFAGLWWSGAFNVTRLGTALALASLAATLFCIAGIALPIDHYVASFLPISERWPLIGLLAIGTLSYTLADAWLIGRQGARWWWYPMAKICLLASLAAAIALDLEGLFFLIIIFPIILLFFIFYGLLQRWIWRATSVPEIGGVATGLAFAWALGVTFPLLAG